MHRLFPSPPASVSPQHAAGLTRPSQTDRPWVMLNMVASIDGAAAVDGLSARLSGPADKAMFAALRAQADIILVGAGTANAERYRQARTSAAGTSSTPIAVISGTLNIDPELPLFAATSDPNASLPLIVTAHSSEASAAERFDGRAELLRFGDANVDLVAALQGLGARGVRIVLCEGGPTLNGSLLALDLVDEINLTHAPLALGTEALRIADGPPADGASQPREFELSQIVTRDGVLFVRWLRCRS